MRAHGSRSPRTGRDRALEAAREIGEVLGRRHGLTNPGIVPWFSMAALALHAFGERAEALALAREELSHARRLAPAAGH